MRKEPKSEQNTHAVEASLLHLVHRVAQRADDLFAAAVTDLDPDLTPRQVIVLAAIGNDEGASQMQIASATGVDRSTLAEIVRRLMVKGLVQRRRSEEDQRAYMVTLSDRGRRLVERAGPIVQQVDEQLIAQLPDGSRQQFAQLLKNIIAASDTPVATRS